MKVRTLFLLVFIGLSSCCRNGNVRYDGNCISQKAADFNSCIKGKGILTEEKQKEIASGIDWLETEATFKYINNIKRTYSEENQRKIIDYCAKLVGIADTDPVGNAVPVQVHVNPRDESFVIIGTTVNSKATLTVQGFFYNGQSDSRGRVLKQAAGHVTIRVIDNTNSAYNDRTFDGQAVVVPTNATVKVKVEDYPMDDNSVYEPDPLIAMLRFD